MKKRSLVIWLIVMTASHFSYAAGKSLEKTLLEQIVAEFQLAIVNKDEEKFLNLFYDHTVVFMGINPDKVRGIKPSNNGLMYSTHLGFIGWIVNSPKAMEEKVWDVNIQTDGHLASIYFKYALYIDSKEENYGDETWNLVKTVEGWKIVSVVYSAIYT